MSGPCPVPDRPEVELDRPEEAVLPKPSGMVLRSQPRTGRSEVVTSAEIHNEKSGVAPRPEPEARPEVETAPVAGFSSDRDVVITIGSPMIDSSGETVETLSEYPFPVRQEPEIASELFHPLKPMHQPRFFNINKLLSRPGSPLF